MNALPSQLSGGAADTPDAQTIDDLRSAVVALNADRANDDSRWFGVVDALASLKGTSYEGEAFELVKAFTLRRDPAVCDAESMLDALQEAWANPEPGEWRSIFDWARQDGWAEPAREEGAPSLPAPPPPDLSEARRLLADGFKLCRLMPNEKRPKGDGWNLHPVKGVDDSATGYGVMLAANGLGSIDPDNLDGAREGLQRCGFDFEALMNAGVRTSSTRPGSGGRSTFKVPQGLGRVVFRSKTRGTLLELRAGQANLQDCLPGTVYLGKHGDGPYVQAYANGRTIDQAPRLQDALPEFFEWWRRCHEDLAFRREQEKLFCPDAMLSVSAGEGKGLKLAHPSAYRIEFNEHASVTEILGRHGYETLDGARWAPPTATGAPGVRAIPGKDDLWRSDHASDALFGTFDAWVAFVTLDHEGDVKAAEQAFESERLARMNTEFVDLRDEARAALEYHADPVFAELHSDDEAAAAIRLHASQLPPDEAAVRIKRIAEVRGWSVEQVQRLQVATAPAVNIEPKPVVDRTDAGNVSLLASLTEGNLRYVPERKVWLWWDGEGWEPDTFGSRAQQEALRVAEHYLSKAAGLRTQARDAALDEAERKRVEKAAEGLEAWGRKCRSRGSLDNMLSLAKHDSRFAIAMERLDSDPWLLGVANGVVDLRTGKLRPAGRDDLVTKRSPVAFVPGAQAPRWRQFIEEITAKPMAGGAGRYAARPALTDYLQRALGYGLTGSTAEHKMFIAVGAGSNGKSVLLDTLQWVMHGYCETIPPEALMTSRYDADGERPTPTARKLAGARVVISSESKDGQRLDVALVKKHTGDGYMTARGISENPVTFEITHKLWLATNHRPTLDHLDDALRGRLHLIPFDMRWNRPGVPERDPSLPDGDKRLPEQIKAEAEGVLAWLVEGARRYVEQGLEPPAEVARMTLDYFQEQDPLGRWLAACTRCDAKQGTSASELFAAFQQWKEVEGEQGGPATQKAFSQALGARGVVKHEGRDFKRWGLTLPA